MVQVDSLAVHGDLDIADQSPVGVEHLVGMIDLGEDPAIKGGLSGRSEKVVQRLGGRRAKQLPVRMDDSVVRVGLRLAQTVLFRLRQWGRLIVKFGRIDALQSNGQLPVLDRRLRSSSLDDGVVEDMGRLER